MKHVRESLKEFYDYKFFSLFEEEAGTDKEVLKSKEQDALKIIDKITKDFEDFKKDSEGKIVKYKEFWEENQQVKKQFTEPGDIYKLFGSDYVVGVLELPVKTLSDGSIEGGLGATDEPEEEIIEGKEVEPKEEFFEEQTVPNAPGAASIGSTATNEAEEGDDLDLDLNLDDEEPTETSKETSTQEDDLNLDLDLDDEKSTETPKKTSTKEPVEKPVEEPMTEEPEKDLTAPQKYLVVYDLTNGEKEEIFRCGSNNAVKAFNAFYNDVFKGSMKSAIANYKKQKEEEKLEAEKAEKKKMEAEKERKIKKFLGESKKVNEDYEEDLNDKEFEKQMEDDNFPTSDENDDFDKWLDDVAEYLRTDFEIEEDDIEMFMDIAMDELEELFDKGESAFDASGIIAANEDYWEKLEQLSKEYEDEEDDEE